MELNELMKYDTNRIVEILNTLTEREQRVLSLRIGLTDGFPKTYAEICRLLDVKNPERIKQIERNALKKAEASLRICYDYKCNWHK